MLPESGDVRRNGDGVERLVGQAVNSSDGNRHAEEERERNARGAGEKNPSKCISRELIFVSSTHDASL